jgi:hypothetical protein
MPLWLLLLLQECTRTLALQLLPSLLANCDGPSFLASYQECSAAALAAVKPPAQQAQQEDLEGSAGHGLQEAAAWRCLACVFRRIGRMSEVPGLKRDAAALASKVAQLALPGAPQGATQACDDMLDALHAALCALPASFRQVAPQLGTWLQGLLRAAAGGGGGCEARQRRIAACVAALPGAAGGGEPAAGAWNALLVRLLHAAHDLLDGLLLGCEDPGLTAASR